MIAFCEEKVRNMKFSFIVPAYNAEKYIKECIDSILAQGFKDYELIVINDGSTDNTLQILNEYKNASNVVIIDSENKGSFRARWLGIEKAKGEYLVFVDSDDCICPNMLDIVNKHLTEDIDLLQFSYVSFSNTKPAAKSMSSEEAVVYGRKDFLDQIVRKTIVNGTEAIVLWNKVYRRKNVLEYINDFSHSFLEDYVFNCEYYVSVNNYKRIFEELYFYRSLPDSLSKKINPNGFEILKQVDQIKSSSLKKMCLDSKADEQNAAAWFIHYLVNGYLFNAYRKKALNSKEIKAILSDSIVLEKSDIVKKSDYDSENAKQIRARKHYKIICKFIVKVWILDIKRFVKKLIRK